MVLIPLNSSIHDYFSTSEENIFGGKKECLMTFHRLFNGGINAVQ